MQTKTNHIERMIRGMLTNVRAEFESGRPTPGILEPIIGAAVRQFNVAVAKMVDWREAVFRGEIEFDEGAQEQLRNNFLAFIELAQYLEGRIKSLNALDGILIRARVARILVSAKENASGHLQHWTRPERSMLPSLRTRKASNVKTIAALP